MFEGFTLNLIKLKNTYADELNIQIHETLSMPKKRYQNRVQTRMFLKFKKIILTVFLNCHFQLHAKGKKHKTGLIIFMNY